MTIRITMEDDGRGGTVRVDGHLAGDAVATLEEVMAAAVNGVRLELSGVLSADSGGLAVLRRLRAAGAELSGLSPYLNLLLEGT